MRSIAVIINDVMNSLLEKRKQEFLTEFHRINGIIDPPNGPEAATVGDACSLLESLYLLKRTDNDFDNGTEMRTALNERFGHQILGAFKSCASRVARNDLKETFTETMLAVKKTLDSPIDDSDKIEHLRSLFDEEMMKKINDDDE
jgi:hypothetical protein